jgi:hypothetical protein
VSADEYVNSIVAKYQVQVGENSTAYVTAMAFKSLAERWAGPRLRSVSVSGSYLAKSLTCSCVCGTRTEVGATRATDALLALDANTGQQTARRQEPR